MGWISRRHMMRGGSLNGNPERQRKGPLRKIVYVVRHSTGIFDPASVVLECGHRTHAYGQERARCVDCAKAADVGNPFA